MKTITFSYNWNNKLNCYVFTTIRLRNDEKYCKGEKYEVILHDKDRQVNKGVHEILDIRHIKLNELPIYVAWCDTGYNAEATRHMIKTMYKNRPINWDRQELSIILLRRDVKDPQLFTKTNEVS